MLENRLNTIGNKLSEKYRTTTINGEKFFIKEDGSVFNVERIPDFNSLVIGYAANISEARNWMLEDGDLFPEDMEVDELLEAMIQEIES